MSHDADRTASLMTPSKLAQARPRAAVSPSAWLDQMASDAGRPHVLRLAELQQDLQAQALQRDYAPLAAQLQNLASALPRLDFSLLQARGWWARTTGKSKSAGAEFTNQFEQISECNKAVAVQTAVLHKRQGGEASATDRSLVEFDVEYQALCKIVEQGAKWLSDMRTQLKARHASAADAQALQQIRDDAARCEILVARLKALRAVSNAALEVQQLARATAARRLALLQMLQQSLAPDIKAWNVRLSGLAAAAGDADSPALGVEGPMETHRELQERVTQASADCTRLRTEEEALAASLAALATLLQAAVPAA